MASNLPQHDSQTRLNNVRGRAAKVQTLPNQPELPEAFEPAGDLASLVETARRRACLKLEYLAPLCGLKSKGQLSSALSGRENFNLRWLDTWPVEFWNEFLPLLRAEKEGTEDAKRLQRKERLLHAIELLFVEVA